MSASGSLDGFLAEEDREAVESDEEPQLPKPQHSVKVLVIGATNAGKTSLVEKYISGKNVEAQTTLCLDVNKVTVTSENLSGDPFDITLYIYDLAGMRKFQKHNSSYYNDVFAVLFVFDATCRVSLDFTLNWLQDYSSFCEVNKFTPSERILVCNKCDLPNTVLNSQQLLDLAQNTGMTCLFECSAVSGRNVDSMFTYIAKQYCIERLGPTCD